MVAVDVRSNWPTERENLEVASGVVGAETESATHQADFAIGGLSRHTRERLSSEVSTLDRLDLLRLC